MGLLIRSVGIARAPTKIGFANLVYLIVGTTLRLCERSVYLVSVSRRVNWQLLIISVSERPVS